MSDRTLRFEIKMKLPASAAEAWRVVADTRAWSDWTTELRTADQDQPPVQAGSQLRIVSGMPFWRSGPIQEAAIDISIDTCVPGEAFIWSGSLLGVKGRHGFEFEAIDDTHCVVTQWEELWGWQTWLVEKLGMWSHLKGSFALLLNQLRSHIAAQAIPRAEASAKIGGARISYRDIGEGAPALLLHGYPQNHLCWRHQIAEFRASRRLIVPDLIGWGDSDRPFDMDHRYESEVDLLVEFIEGLDCGPLDLIAHDYGGYLALGIARQRPDLIKSLVILNSRAHGTFKRRWRWFFMLTQQWLARIPLLGRLVKWLPVRTVHEWVLRDEIRKGLFDGAILESYIGHMKRGSLGNQWIYHFFKAATGYSFAPRPELLEDHVAHLRCLVIWGEDDRFLSSDLAEQLATLLPNGELNMLPDVGHYVMEEAPDEVNDALKAFLSRD